jgi:sialate O-acetylesterase
LSKISVHLFEFRNHSLFMKIKFSALCFLKAITPLLGLALGVTNTKAEVKVANIFNDHMVLPREIPIPVWGTAEAGETITVNFAGASKSTTAADDGSWLVNLDALPASAESRALTFTGSKSSKPIEFKDVLVGEVWLASGQSNMATSGGPAAGEADTPLVRIGGVEGDHSSEALKELRLRCRWKNGSSKDAPGCSGSALYFARGLQAELKIPIGVIVSAVGGSRIEAWLRREALDKTLPVCEYRDKMLQAVETAKTNPTSNPENKPAVHVVGTQEWAAARLGGRYNGMIAPLARFPIRGVIWYQGEDNAREYQEYEKLLPTMIADMRALWKKQFPFLIVQLPAYNADGKPEGTSWAAMREVQERVARNTPGCGYAVVIDNNDPKELHPKNKPAVGDRIARVALRQVYGLTNVAASGPVFDSMKIDGSNAVIGFKQDGNGLVSTSGDKLTGFQIAGADKKYVAADAKIEGGNVVVSSAEVSQPVAVRYAWLNAPAVSLANKAGLPAAPFRTDDW